jgi:hypothetical protein
MVRLFLGFAIATVGLLLPEVVLAQRGPQLFDFFLQQANQELQRQQQREYERQQREELNRLHQQFIAQWHACHRDALDACEQALAYPYLNFNDRQRLIAKRAQIITTQQEAAERARRERIEAELEERRRQTRAREELAERERAQELSRRRLEDERQREQKERADRERAQELILQREAAERQRRLAEEAERKQAAAEAQLAVFRKQQAEEQEHRRASTIWWALASVLVIGAIAISLSLIYFFRDALSKSALHFRDLFQRFKLAILSASSSASPVPSQTPQDAASTPLAPEPQASAGPQFGRTPNAPLPPPEYRPRDTVGAIAAMELAHAYIEEVRDADMPGLEDTDARRHNLNTLSLASRQLDAAERLDPDGILEGRDAKENSYRFTINELKAEALLLEGLTHQVYDTKRAIPALIAATTANPNNPNAFYVLGLTHAANRNRSDAVAALQRAVALEPRNLAYRKELNRAESLTTAEIAGYKATRAGEKIFDAGVKTANAGIFVYNIGVYTWNVFAFTWNVLTFPIRIVFKIFGLFDRVLGAK